MALVLGNGAFGAEMLGAGDFGVFGRFFLSDVWCATSESNSKSV